VPEPGGAVRAAPAPRNPTHALPVDHDNLRKDAYRLALLLAAGNTDLAMTATRRATRGPVEGRAAAAEPVWSVVRDRLVAHLLHPDRRRGRTAGRPPLAATEPLWVALREMKPSRRAIVVLHQYEHLEDQEIADMLGVTPGLVASELVRGTESLREVSSRGLS